MCVANAASATAHAAACSCNASSLSIAALQGKLYIVMECCRGGNLHEMIAQGGRQGLPETVVWRLLIQLLLALRHMHSQRVLHRDIKSLNVFLSESGTVKLGDLGVAKVRGSDSGPPKAHQRITK